MHATLAVSIVIAILALAFSLAFYTERNTARAGLADFRTVLLILLALQLLGVIHLF